MEKPDKKIFDFAARKMKLEPAAACYIGDSYSNDIIGAKQAGWKTVWFNRRNRVIPANGLQSEWTAFTEQQLYQIVNGIERQPQE